MPYSDGESMSMPSPESVNKNHVDHSETIDVERMDDDDSSNDSRFQLRTNSNTARSTSIRNPLCALCKNHYVNSPLKGHKRYCSFSNCDCHLCRVTRKKQKVNASQVSSRRAQQQDRELGINHRSTFPSPSISSPSTPRMPDSPPPILSEPKRISNGIQTSLTQRSTHRIPSSANSTPRPLATHYPLSGSVILGENMSLECFLLRRNVSFLSNSLNDSMLSFEQLQILDNEVSNIMRVVKGDISRCLIDIHKYLLERLQREQSECASKNIFQPLSNTLSMNQAALNKMAIHEPHIYSPMYELNFRNLPLSQEIPISISQSYGPQ